MYFSEIGGKKKFYRPPRTKYVATVAGSSIVTFNHKQTILNLLSSETEYRSCLTGFQTTLDLGYHKMRKF